MVTVMVTVMASVVVAVIVTLMALGAGDRSAGAHTRPHGAQPEMASRFVMWRGACGGGCQCGARSGIRLVRQRVSPRARACTVQVSGI